MQVGKSVVEPPITPSAMPKNRFPKHKKALLKVFLVKLLNSWKFINQKKTCKKTHFYLLLTDFKRFPYYKLNILLNPYFTALFYVFDSTLDRLMLLWNFIWRNFEHNSKDKKLVKYYFNSFASEVIPNFQRLIK